MNQDKEVRIAPAELEQAMRGEFKELVKETADAMNDARDGAIIADSEWIVNCVAWWVWTMASARRRPGSRSSGRSR